MLFVDKKISQLLANDSIAILPPEKLKSGWLSNIFLVPKKVPGEFCMILNVKGLNQYIQYRKFKMDQIYKVLDMVQPEIWATSIDLVDAYSHLFVSPVHWSYLAFRWRGVLYHFKCLPQGLTSAPRIFTQVVQPIIAFLRMKMIQIVIYIDDTIILARHPFLLQNHTAQVIDTFQKCGFTVNFAESQLTPTQTIEFLGFLIDTVCFQVSLTDKK